MQLKKTLILILVALICFNFILVGCNNSKVIGVNRIQKPDERIIDSFDTNLVEKTNEFGIKLFNSLANGKENVLLSPTSIALALSMTYNGARGETKEAIKEVLGVNEVDLERFNENNLALMYLLQETDESIYLNIANSLWMREGIEFDPEFIKRNEEYYNALSSELDFDSPDSADKINDWVYRKTGGLIEDIVEPPIDPTTILFLINAIYFKGDWTEPFSEKNTYKDDFYLSDSSIIAAEYMNRFADYKYYEEEDFQAVRIPYGKEERMGMYVFLPSEGLNLQEFLVEFDFDSWEKLNSKFMSSKVNLSLPKFMMEYEKTLNDVLKNMGMEIAFEQSRADFFDMVSRDEGPRLYINEVKHKSFIEVNEKGTEAAAVTSVEIRVESATIHEFEMKINRPFFFIIHDEKTDAIIFMGTVTEPNKILY